MRRLVSGLAVPSKLMADSDVVQPVPEAVWMIEHFGQCDRLGEMLMRLLFLTRQLPRITALGMRANAGIVAPKRVRKVTVLRHIVKRDDVLAALERAADIATKMRR
jgi:hypothetical protein